MKAIVQGETPAVVPAKYHCIEFNNVFYFFNVNVPGIEMVGGYDYPPESIASISQNFMTHCSFAFSTADNRK